MALLIITTILWAFSFSFYGEYLAGHVDSYFAVLVRVGLAALVFLPFLRTRGNSLKTVGLYMLVGAMQLGVMYMLCIDSREVRKKPGRHWIIRDLTGLDLVGLASL